MKASFAVSNGDPVVIRPAHLGSDLAPVDFPGTPPLPEKNTLGRRGLSLNEEIKRFKRRIIRQALEQNQGNWAAAARALGMHRSNLHNLAKRLGLKG